VDTQVADDEIRAIRDLYHDGGHRHIVTITKIGDIPQNIFIDMELCDLNLDDFIHCRKDGIVPTYFVKDEPPPVKSQQIWNVMSQIALGVEFLHGKKMVHRDLKPVNGIDCHALHI
jgi:serine/threonine protein kinase